MKKGKDFKILIFIIECNIRKKGKKNKIYNFKVK